MKVGRSQGAVRSLWRFLSVLVLLTTSESVLAQVPSVTFSPARTDYVVGASASSVAVGFFNNSAGTVPDVVVANQNGNSVSVLMGNGDGSFQPAVQLPVGVSPAIVQVADFNGDGNADIVTMNNGAIPSISVLLGNGDGTFKTAKTTNIGVGNTPVGLAVGAFVTKSPTVLDVAVTVNLGINSYAAAVMLGNADGTFQSAKTYALTGVLKPQTSIQTMALTSSGNSDLFITNSDGTISVLLGHGDGSFASVSNTSITSSALTSSLLADFNGDGKPDAAVGDSSTGQIFILLGNGNGTFNVQTPFTGPTGSIVTAWGDLNPSTDKIPDLVVTGTRGAVWVFLGNGDGTFTPGQQLATVGTPSSVAVGTFNIANNAFPGLAVADQNTGTVPTAPDIVSILLGNGDGTFAIAPSFTAADAGNALGAILSGDFNNDGRPDVLGVFTPSTPGNPDGLGLLLGAANNYFSPVSTTALASTDAGTTSPVVGDFNGDGVPDVAVQVAGTGYVAVLLAATDSTGQGNGSFQAEKDTSAVVDGPIAAGDFTGDGKLDLVATASNGVSILPGNGDGSFGTAMTTSLASCSSSNPTSIATGDFNGDKNLDLAVSTSSGVCVLLGNGQGGFGTPTLLASSFSTFVTASDLNNDGKLDLVIANNASGANTVSVLLGNGDGTFQSPVSINVVGFNNPTFIAVDDYNLDGFADIAVMNSGWNDVGILLGTGNGKTFQVSGNLGTNGAGPLVSADFDADGAPDLAVVNGGTITAGLNTFSLLLNIALSGAATADPTVLDFGQVAVNGLGSTQAVLLTNTGKIPLQFGGATVSDNTDYSASNDCPASLPNGANCTITVQFAPTLAGKLEATLTIQDRVPSSENTVTLIGTGVVPTISVAPTSITFPTTPVGGQSTPQNITVTNTGTVQVSMGPTTLSDNNDYAVTQNTCGGTLNVGANCVITVNFSPQAGGTLNSTLTIQDNAAGNPQTVSLSGTGVAATLSVAPGTLAFGNAAVGGGPSAAMVVTITNNSSVASATIGNVSLGDSNDYAQTNTCGGPLAPGAACTVSVQFQPLKGGQLNTTLTITDNATGSPQTVNITGTGVVPTLNVSPSSLAFGTVVVASGATAPQTVTISNTGIVAAGIGTIVLSDTTNYAQTNTCGSSLAVGANCTISVQFAPTTAGAHNATVTITDNAAGSPQVVNLTGSGTTDPLGFKVSGASSKTVQPGQTADFTFSIGGQGFSGSASISCIGAPQGATCNVPATVDVNGTTASTVSVTISTTGPATGTVSLLRRTSAMWAMGIFGLVILPAASRRGRGKLRVLWIVPVLVLLLMSGCGGGNSSSSGGSGGSGQSTPAGTYPISVRAQAQNATTDTVSLTLIVQ